VGIHTLTTGWKQGHSRAVLVGLPARVLLYKVQRRLMVFQRAPKGRGYGAVEGRWIVFLHVYRLVSGLLALFLSLSW
jgi:hypothetical protein